MNKHQKELLERYKAKNFYNYIFSFKTETPFNRFEAKSHQLEKFLENLKDGILKGLNENLKQNILFVPFNKNPFKSFKYEDIGK